MITKRNIKITGFMVLISLMLIQFIPKNYNESGRIEETDFFNIYTASEKIQKQIKTSCYDCHSNHTNYPWYNKIQPIAMFLEDHINEGKEELNFSEFGKYSKRKVKSKLKAIRNQINDGEIPLKTYTFIHKDAILSERDKTEILQWINNLLEK